ncbi:hypothetical protein CRENBAI_008123 [Crenichthys baileyi]|uniref:Uncharacterized protein n=1 Tax=Crenichthys baileyi TaxID=28760 RepID=A0AAV9QM76_9TELE
MTFDFKSVSDSDPKSDHDPESSDFQPSDFQPDFKSDSRPSEFLLGPRPPEFLLGRPPHRRPFRGSSTRRGRPPRRRPPDEHLCGSSWSRHRSPNLLAEGLLLCLADLLTESPLLCSANLLTEGPLLCLADLLTEGPLLCSANLLTEGPLLCSVPTGHSGYCLAVVSLVTGSSFAVGLLTGSFSTVGLLTGSCFVAGFLIAHPGQVVFVFGLSPSFRGPLCQAWSSCFCFWTLALLPRPPLPALVGLFLFLDSRPPSEVM